MTNELISFENSPIRKVWHNEEWYFNISDIIAILIITKDAKAYWRKMKQRLVEEGGSEVVTNCHALKFEAPDGKSYKSDAVNTEGILRIIMSIPSPKAEPLKMWLAEQGKRAIDEAENPELLTQRQIELYKAKGYSDEWINERIKNIDIRKQLTEEWKNRGVQEGQEYSILTAVIAKGTFGIAPSEHKKIKGLTKPSQNLRDHMTNLELIFTSLGEELTREEAVNEDAQGFEENKDAAVKGGGMAGKLLKTLEKERGKKVISSKNHLNSISENETSALPPSE